MSTVTAPRPLSGIALAGLVMGLAVLAFVGVTDFYPIRIEGKRYGVRIGGTVIQAFPGERAPWGYGSPNVDPWQGWCVRSLRPPELQGPGSATNYYYYEVSWMW